MGRNSKNCSSKINMRKEKIINVGGFDITVREFTVSDVDWIYGGIRADGDDPHPFDLIVDSEITFDLVLRSTGETAQDFPLDARQAADLQKLYDQVAALNPFLTKKEACATSENPPKKRKKCANSGRETLRSWVCTLVTVGHIHVWDYGFSMFETAVKHVSSKQ